MLFNVPLIDTNCPVFPAVVDAPIWPVPEQIDKTTKASLDSPNSKVKEESPPPFLFGFVQVVGKRCGNARQYQAVVGDPYFVGPFWRASNTCPIV
jgi:hypothetical protein